MTQNMNGVLNGRGWARERLSFKVAHYPPAECSYVRPPFYWRSGHLKAELDGSGRRVWERGRGSRKRRRRRNSPAL